jgi:sugar transferase EpsL
MYRRFGKRLLDLALVIPACLFLSPVLLLVAALVRLGLGAPVLFRQRRPGLEGRPFTLYKFRTMRDTCDAEGWLLPDAERLTVLGRFLRLASLDELPELFNVVRGEMSLVGPRPLLPEYLDRYTPEQARRHQVRPGITGWAQINGRQTIYFSKRLELDVWYVDHLALGLDLKILLLTIPRALASQGVIPGQDVADVDDLGLSAPPGTGPGVQRDQGAQPLRK